MEAGAREAAATAETAATARRTAVAAGLAAEAVVRARAVPEATRAAVARLAEGGGVAPAEEESRARAPRPGKECTRCTLCRRR